MILLLIIAAFGFSLVSAGVDVLTPEEELQVLQLLKRTCKDWSNVNSNDPIQDGGNSVFCKAAEPEPPREFVHHVKIEGPTEKPISILIQPPPTKHFHNIILKGEYKGQDTRIYVLPDNDRHEVSIGDVKLEHKMPKPEIFYLKDRHQPESLPNFVRNEPLRQNIVRNLPLQQNYASLDITPQNFGRSVQPQYNFVRSPPLQNFVRNQIPQNFVDHLPQINFVRNQSPHNFVRSYQPHQQNFGRNQLLPNFVRSQPLQTYVSSNSLNYYGN